MAYVYRHIRHDKNEPFYIGIGKTKYRHTAKQNRNDIWEKIVAKTTYDVEVLFEDVTWDFACGKEIEFIRLYGRINNNTGILANMTNGGDGNLGLKHSPEAIAKISEASKNRPGYWLGKKMPDEMRVKLSISKTGKPNPKRVGVPASQSARDAVRKHSIGNKYHLGKPHTEDSKKKMSENKKALKLGKPVLQYSLSGDFIEEFYCCAEAAIRVGVNANSIRVAAKKGHTCKGFKWKLKNQE